MTEGGGRLRLIGAEAGAMITGDYRSLHMSSEPATAPITIRAAKETVSEIDALAAAMDRSRNYVVNQAIRPYLETNAWQVERIRAGLDDARAGPVSAEERRAGKECVRSCRSRG